MIRMKRLHCLAALGAMALLHAPMAGAAPDTLADPAAATADFFAKVSAKDLDAVARYLPAEGFTEIVPESKALLHLDAKAFEGLFKSGRRIDLRVADLRLQRFGDTALVTGTRLGGIGAPDAAPVDSRLAFTMVWTRTPSGWQLRHLHLSPQP